MFRYRVLKPKPRNYLNIRIRVFVDELNCDSWNSDARLSPSNVDRGRWCHCGPLLATLAVGRWSAAITDGSIHSPSPRMRIEPLRGSVPRAPLPLRPTGTNLPRVLGTPTGLCPTFGAGAIAVVTRGGEVLDSKSTKPRRALGQFCRRRISQRTTEIGSARRRARLFLPVLRLYGRNLPLLGHTANGARPDLGSPLLFQTGQLII